MKVPTLHRTVVMMERAYQIYANRAPSSLRFRETLRSMASFSYDPSADTTGYAVSSIWKRVAYGTLFPEAARIVGLVSSCRVGVPLWGFDLAATSRAQPWDMEVERRLDEAVGLFLVALGILEDW